MSGSKGNGAIRNGAELRNYRATVGVTQAELAGMLGTTERTIRRWENGTKPIPRYVPLALEALVYRMDKDQNRLNLDLF